MNDTERLTQLINTHWNRSPQILATALLDNGVTLPPEPQPEWTYTQHRTGVTDFYRHGNDAGAIAGLTQQQARKIVETLNPETKHPDTTPPDNTHGPNTDPHNTNHQPTCGHTLQPGVHNHPKYLTCQQPPNHPHRHTANTQHGQMTWNEEGNWSFHPA